MQNLGLHCIAALALVVATTATSACAQSSTSKRPKEAVVGIALDSNYARIADYLPSLRNSLVKTLSKPKKHVKAVPIDAGHQDAVAAAQKKGCDYLLRLSVSEMTGVGGGFSTFPRGRDPEQVSPEERREREELSWVVVNYRLRSLNHDDLDISDIDHVRYADLPIGWDPSSFETTIFRTVTRVAIWTVNQLPKK